MSRYDRYTPRNIIQKKYYRSQFKLFLVAFAALTVVSVLALSVLNLSFGTSDIVVYRDSLLEQPATAVESISQDAPELTEGDVENNATAMLAKPLPTRLSIPKIDLETGFVEPLGLLENEEIEVPNSYTDVGWYEYGPTPGDQGPAIILGHVDSVDGPAVLYNLKELEVGDSIYIDRDDGIRVRFIVESTSELSQDTFPTEEVYSNLDYAGLKIITCTGTYQESEMRYTHNLVVTARLVGLDFENSLSL